MEPPYHFGYARYRMVPKRAVRFLRVGLFRALSTGFRSTGLDVTAVLSARLRLRDRVLPRPAKRDFKSVSILRSQPHHSTKTEGPSDDRDVLPTHPLLPVALPHRPNDCFNVIVRDAANLVRSTSPAQYLGAEGDRGGHARLDKVWQREEKPPTDPTLKERQRNPH